MEILNKLCKIVKPLNLKSKLLSPTCSLFFIFLMSCHKDHSSNKNKVLIAIDSFYIHLNGSKKWLIKPFKNKQYPDKVCLFIPEDNLFTEYSIFKKTIIRKEKIKCNMDLIDFFPVSKDSIFFISRSNEIILVDSELTVKRIYSLSIPHLVAASSYEYPFEIYNNKALLYLFPKEPLSTKEKLKNYFNTCLEFEYNLLTNQLKNTQTACFPFYIKKNHRYVFNPIRVLGNYLLYIFPCSDTIYVYNRNNYNYLKKIKIHSSNFIENSDFDDGKIMNYNYISQYLTENSRFLSLQYNVHQHLYYLVLLHSAPYLSDRNTIVKWIDKPASLIVLDSTLNKKDEYYIPPQKFNLTKCYVVAENLLIADYSSTLINTDTLTKIYVFKVF